TIIADGAHRIRVARASLGGVVALPRLHVQILVPGFQRNPAIAAGLLVRRESDDVLSAQLRADRCYRLLNRMLAVDLEHVSAGFVANLRQYIFAVDPRSFGWA